MRRAFSPQGENHNHGLRSPAGLRLVARPPPWLARRDGLQFASAPPLEMSTQSPTSRRGGVFPQVCEERWSEIQATTDSSQPEAGYWVRNR